MKTTLNPTLVRRFGKTAAKKTGTRARCRASLPSCPSEHEEQKALIIWVTAQIGRGRSELALLYAIPNGAFFGDDSKTLKNGKKLPMGVIRGRRMAAEGLKEGVPDLCLPVPRGGHLSLYIEMKRRKGGVVSAKQKWWHDQLRGQGHAVIVPEGCEQAIVLIQAYLNGREKEDGL